MTDDLKIELVSFVYCGSNEIGGQADIELYEVHTLGRLMSDLLADLFFGGNLDGDVGGMYGTRTVNQAAGSEEAWPK